MSFKRTGVGLTLALGVVLAACQTTPEATPAVANEAADACREYGLSPEMTDYARCVNSVTTMLVRAMRGTGVSGSCAATVIEVTDQDVYGVVTVCGAGADPAAAEIANHAVAEAQRACRAYGLSPGVPYYRECVERVRPLIYEAESEAYLLLRLRLVCRADVTAVQPVVDFDVSCDEA
jgi:hypothetical protein